MSVAKKAKGVTPPSQFRLDKEVLRRLDRIASHLTIVIGVKHSRADAIRVISKICDPLFGAKEAADLMTFGVTKVAK